MIEKQIQEQQVAETMPGRNKRIYPIIQNMTENNTTQQRD